MESLPIEAVKRYHTVEELVGEVENKQEFKALCEARSVKLKVSAVEYEKWVVEHGMKSHGFMISG